jgi:cytochrome P450
VSPLPRIVPFDTIIAGIPVPAGVRFDFFLLTITHIQQTVVAMGATFMHNNPNVFIDPKKFDPDRWLQPNTTELEENLVPFSKGPRSCLGVKCVIYLLKE